MEISIIVLEDDSIGTVRDREGLCTAGAVGGVWEDIEFWKG